MKTLPQYRSPSVPRIKAHFHTDTTTAQTVRGLIRGEIDPESIPATEGWCRDCYNQPRHLDALMHALNAVLECHGVEGIRGRGITEPAAEYLNTGDTYSPTLLYRYDTKAFSLTTWGDFVERNEKKITLNQW